MLTNESLSVEHHVAIISSIRQVLSADEFEQGLVGVIVNNTQLIQVVLSVLSINVDNSLDSEGVLI